MYNGPGKYLTQSNPYAALLLRNSKNLNNGSDAGGLASVLNQGLLGYSVKQDRDKAEADRQAQIEAQQALASGLTGAMQEGARPDGTADVRTPGSLSAALKNLSGMEGNPYAVEMATKLAMQEMQLRQQQEQAAAERAASLEDYETKKGIDQQYAAAPKEVQLWQMAQQDPGFAEFLGQTGGSNTPAAVQEYQFFQRLSPEQQAQFLTVKRSNPWIDRGDARVLPNPAQPGQTMATMPKGVAPDQTVKDGQVITTPGMQAPPMQFGPQSFAPPQSVTPGMITSDSPEKGGIAGHMGQPQIPPQPVQGMPGQNIPTPGQPQVQELPPSPQEQQKQAALQQKASAALSSLERQSQTVVDTIDRALGLAQGPDGKPNNWATGYGSVLSFLPNSPAGTLQNELMTIKANIGFDKLQQMRDNSPTGGALGQVSEFENKLLQAVNGALDPAQADQLISNLKVIRELYPQVLAERRAAFQQDFGGGEQSPEQPSSGFTVRKVN